MCIDYTDLNKTYPKDSYPLPIIDQLVDSMAYHSLYRFIDVTQGYHHIPKKKKEKEKKYPSLFMKNYIATWLYLSI